MTLRFFGCQLLLIVLCLYIDLPRSYAEGIGMVTGSRTGTYFQFGKNIAEVARQVVAPHLTVVMDTIAR